jgi:ATP-dependent exoDNAse (exonuclease V) beta subunit
MPDFTRSQLDAIEYRRLDACVVAGPGSGKTTVLVERFRSLIELHRFDPGHILAITFTEKAAANMKAKLAELFAHDATRLRDLESAWVSTIHGFCARLLRENAIAAGIDPRFSVLDAREAEQLQYDCMNAALDDFVATRRADALELIESLQDPLHIVDHLGNVYDAFRSAGKTAAEVRAMPVPSQPVNPAIMAVRLRSLLSEWPAKLTPLRARQRAELLEWALRLSGADPAHFDDLMGLLDDCPLNFGRIPPDNKPPLRDFEVELTFLKVLAVDSHYAPYRAMIFDILERFESLYRDRKTSAGQLDFNDLERRAIALLSGTPEVRDRVRAQFRQVMLDEFQDINEQQHELIRLVRGDDVFFAVGDVNQSIYGFRHARPEIFTKYRQHIADNNKHSAELLHSFRSRAPILRFIEVLLNSEAGIDPRELVAGVAFPAKSDPSIEVLKIQDEDRDIATAREARWIAHRILALRGTLDLVDGRKADFKDFAVLCRNSESMRPILDEFDARGIPYVCGRRQSFLLSREGLDIAALLETIANPRNEIALVTVLRSALVGVIDEALLRLRLLASSVSNGMNAFAHDPGKLADFAPADARKLERFARNLKRWRAQQPVIPMELLIVRALSDCGYQYSGVPSREANVESFLRLARAKGDRHTLLGFLREIESLQNALNAESDLSDQDQGNCVQVMTAHAAKGLEFPVVIVAAMEKGTQRDSAPVSFTPECGLGLKWKDPGSKKGLDDGFHLRNSDLLREREKHEEHRLLYVAMTRAAEHLILSYSKISNWAKMVDRFLQLNSNGESFDVALTVADADPPTFDSLVAPGPGENAPISVTRPLVDGQPESAVNVTSLALFAACPRKYYIGRYIGWNGNRPHRFDPEDLPDDAPDTPAAELGSMVHEILAGKPAPPDPEARRLADVFLNSDLGIRAAASPRSAREWDFIVDVRGMMVRGTVDLWFEENGEIHLVDYKTDDLRADDENHAAFSARANDYAPQLALYALAIQQAFGRRPAHAWLHFLRFDRLVEIPLGDNALDAAADLVAQLRDAQSTLRFDLREGDHCRSCQFYRALCPAGVMPY